MVPREYDNFRILGGSSCAALSCGSFTTRVDYLVVAFLPVLSPKYGSGSLGAIHIHFVDFVDAAGGRA